MAKEIVVAKEQKDEILRLLSVGFQHLRQAQKAQDELQALVERIIGGGKRGSSEPADENVTGEGVPFEYLSRTQLVYQATKAGVPAEKLNAKTIAQLRDILLEATGEKEPKTDGQPEKGQKKLVMRKKT